MNYDDWKTSPPPECREPSEEEFDAAIDDVIDFEDIAELVKKDPVMRLRFLFLRTEEVSKRAEEIRDEALDGDRDEDFVDNKDGDS